MPDIYHDFPIRAPLAEVFQAISSAPGLDRWWTLGSSGQPAIGAEYELEFGPEYQWQAKVTRCTPNTEFELEMVKCAEDWRGTRVGFELEDKGSHTQVRFRHTGWPECSEHFRVSSCCWAAYLRILRRFLEHGETVPYASRLDA
jgi:uncharacterized protein YndB with AHSA1/START domain